VRILRALGDYFTDLMEGDLVAWLFTGIIVGFAALIGIIAWRVKVNERREEERKRRKPGGKKDR
jgi:hypothetical protein